MDLKRGMLCALVSLVVSPFALGVGVVFLVAAFDDESPPDLAAGTLRIGRGAVPAKYAGLIQKAASACDQGLPAAVLAAQLMQESGFNPRAVSPANAQGIAQFIPSTWASAGLDGDGDGRKDPFDPEDAIPAQGRMMCELVKTAKKHPGYHGSPIELALAGYNAGWGRVDQFRGVPPRSFARGETYDYVRVIMAKTAELTGVGSQGSSGWTLPVNARLGTPYHQRGALWSSGYHTGIDFGVPTGTPIKAAGPGTVVKAGHGGSYGNEVVIRHADGMYSQYAHLSSLTVAKGQKVNGGQRIGLSGATGNVTGPHLHMEIRTGPSYGSDVSPLPYLRKHGVTI